MVRVAAVETEEAPALEKGVKTDDVKVESSKTETKAEEKFVDSLKFPPPKTVKIASGC